MIAVKRVAQNTLVTLVSALCQKFFTIIYFIAVANHYGPADQGGYSSAIAFTTLAAVFLDLGISSAMTREVAREKIGASPLVGQMLALRIASSVLVYPAMLIIAHVLHYAPEIISLIILAGIVAVVDTFTVAAWFTVRGFQNLTYESIASAVAVVLMVACGFTIMAAGLPILYLLYATLAGTLVNFAAATVVLFRVCGFTISLLPKVDTLRRLLFLSAPFMAAAIFSRVYTFVDMSLLPILASAQAAGWYAAGAKIMLAMNVIPAAFSSSLYPAMSASFALNRERVGLLCARGIGYLAMIAIPIGVGIFVLSNEIVFFLYHDSYHPTVSVFKILAPGIVSGFLMFPLGALLASTNRQGINTLIFGFAATANVLLNVILIPHLAERGAAIAATSTYVIIFSASLLYCWSHLAIHGKFLATILAKIVIASVAMGIVVIFLKGFSPILVTLLCGVFAYSACVFAFRVIRMQELRSFFIADKR